MNELGESQDVNSGKGGWDSGEIETISQEPSTTSQLRVERVDGTQARLKLYIINNGNAFKNRGKGGWDSGEIETVGIWACNGTILRVERVDGTQARLKQLMMGRMLLLFRDVERVDGTQARLKLYHPYS